MSRVVVGLACRGETEEELSIRRSGSLVTFEVGGRARYKIQARNAHIAREVEERCTWWLSRRVFPSFDALHQHVVEELDRAIACASRMQRGSVYRSGPMGGLR